MKNIKVKKNWQETGRTKHACECKFNLKVYHCAPVFNPLPFRRHKNIFTSSLSLLITLREEHKIEREKITDKL